MTSINNITTKAINTAENAFSNADMIITDFNTGKVEIQEVGEFAFLVDTQNVNCLVLIPEDHLLNILKSIVSNGAENEIYFDSENEIAMQCSFGKVKYQKVYLGQSAKAKRELNLFLQERF